MGRGEMDRTLTDTFGSSLSSLPLPLLGMLVLLSDLLMITINGSVWKA